MDLLDARALLGRYGQAHLLKYYDELPEERRKLLLSRIEKTDLSVLSALHENVSQARGKLEPLSALTVDEIEKDRLKFEREGLKALRAGKVGAVLLAGGQGTRLGFDKPKGLYNIGVTHDLYIFECIFKNALDTMKRSGVFFPFLIMTSRLNRKDTEDFLREKDFFGYDPAFVRFFEQDTAPAADFDGKILLADKDEPAESPNGNGGWFSSLMRSGLMDWLKALGVEYLSAFGVDNVCQRINDPAFVGAFIRSGCDCAGKAVRKADPNERVGVLCLEDGRPSIVEYYEMTDDMITLRDEKGVLLYNYGVILNYIFKVSKLQEIEDARMPVHVVKKKVPYLNDAGERVEPAEPNAYKFEYLILDMVHMMDSCLPYEVVREKEFAPIKNATGVDSVESARELLRLNGVRL